MKTISKEALFAADDLHLTDVPLPDDYGKDMRLRVRKMTGHERAALEKRHQAGETCRKDPEGTRWEVIRNTVVGEDGELFFADSDREAFMGKAEDLMDLLFDQAMSISKLGEDAIEDTAKN